MTHIHTHTHIQQHTITAIPMLTNSAILPFSVLIVAGWCGVSNLIKQDVANNSWVCVWKVSQDTSVLVKAGPERWGGASGMEGGQH